MAAPKPSKEIFDFMAAHGIESDEIWCVHNTTWVVKHKALERVAAEKGIKFEQPFVIEKDSASGIAVISVAGQLGERVEWSIGEASPKNNKNAYPYAMAEKRAKDRVILKLLTSHGELYSEAEADEFTQRQNPHVTRPEDIHPPVERDGRGQPVDNIEQVEPGEKLTVAAQRPIFKALQDEIHATGSSAALQVMIASADFKDRFARIKPDWQEMLRGVYAEHLAELRKQEQGDKARDMRMAG